MPAGTPTELDSFFLSQSTVFKNRVQSELMKICEAIENEAITGVTGTEPSVIHQARMNFVKTIQNPSQASSWLPQFVQAASVDPTLIAAATVAASNYTPITSTALADTAAAEGGAITDTMVSNALSGAFNTFVPGI